MVGVAGQLISFIVKDVIWNVLYFPIWWYTRGVYNILTKIKLEIVGLARTLHLPTLFKYLLKPMYGYTDIVSRIISFYVRIVQFIVLLAFTLVVLSLLLLELVVWITLPLVVAYEIVFSLGLTQVNLFHELVWNAGLQN